MFHDRRRLGAIQPKFVSVSSTLKTGLVSFWEFQTLVSGTTFADVHSGNNPLIANANLTAATGSGIVGNAAQTPGADPNEAYTTGTNPTGIIAAPPNTWSLAFWVFLNDATQTCGLATKADNAIGLSNTNRQFYLTYTTTNINFIFMKADQSNNDFLQHSISAFSNSTWHFIVAISTGTDFKISVDNSDPNAAGHHMTMVQATAVVETSNRFKIGTDGAEWLITGGRIDQCGWWNRTLTTTEIGQLWNGGAGLAYSAM